MTLRCPQNFSSFIFNTRHQISRKPVHTLKENISLYITVLWRVTVESLRNGMNASEECVASIFKSSKSEKVLLFRSRLMAFFICQESRDTLS